VSEVVQFPEPDGFAPLWTALPPGPGERRAAILAFPSGTGVAVGFSVGTLRQPQMAGGGPPPGDRELIDDNGTDLELLADAGADHELL
jgi:hypothetical protein